MRKLTIALSLFAALLSQQSLAQSSDPVVMTVAGVDVPRSEFEYSFNKNNGDGVAEKKTVEEYAELYANYKLKVQAALDAKLDTMTSFQQEYAMYRDQQVRPTIVTDDELLATARKMYERTKEAIGPRGLVHPAHILLELSTQATAQEQEKTRQRIDSAYRALQAGADFAELAKKISQDPVSSKDGGLLPWFGPGQTLKEFEDVAFKIEPLVVSDPVKTRFGWHLIMVTKKVPAVEPKGATPASPEKVQASHILIKTMDVPAEVPSKEEIEHSLRLQNAQAPLRDYIMGLRAAAKIVAPTFPSLNPPPPKPAAPAAAKPAAPAAKPAPAKIESKPVEVKPAAKPTAKIESKPVEVKPTAKPATPAPAPAAKPAPVAPAAPKKN